MCLWLFIKRFVSTFAMTSLSLGGDDRPALGAMDFVDRISFLMARSQLAT